jgi:superfamily II DNA/RNA helicase
VFLTIVVCGVQQAVVKSLSAHVKLRSAGITSGVKLKIQKESLASPVDIIVSTPGRFLQHFEHERVFLSELRYLVVDEGDTLFDKTFKEDIVRRRSLSSHMFWTVRHVLMLV